MMFRSFFIVSLSSCLLACSSLPDIDRAVEFTEKGEYQKAQSELRQLADFGLPLAKLKLADMYVKVGGEDANHLAEDLYTQILQQDPRAYSRLAKLYRKKVVKGELEYFSKSADLFTKSTAAGDEDSLADLTGLYLSNPQFLNQNIPIEQWIKTRASHGDIRADYDLARLYILRGQGLDKKQQIDSLCLPLIPTVAGCYDVLAQVYRATKNNDALQKLNVDLLSAYHSHSVTPWFVYQYAIALTKGDMPRVDLAMTLQTDIAAEYPKAYMAMARLIVRNKELATKEELLSLIEERARAGVPEAHYLLGRLYFDGDWIAQNPQQAVAHLEQAGDEFSGSSFLLGLIHKEGLLGEPNFPLALSYLLKAARAGSASADRELAEMYWQQKGVKRNAVYAYSFAELAAQEGSEKTKILFDSIIQGTSAEQQFLGESLRIKEVKLRDELVAEKETRLKLDLQSQLVTQ